MKFLINFVCFLFPFSSLRKRVRAFFLERPKALKLKSVMKGWNGEDPIILIKSPHPADSSQWGDLFLANDLKEAFGKEGKFAVVLAKEYWNNKELNKIACASITLRGRKVPEKIFKNQISILYMISHPDEIEMEDLNRYTCVACASKCYTKKLEQRKVRAFYVPQFTSQTRFKSSLKSKDYHHKLLYVGSTRGIFREGVKFSIERNLPISVYGRGWNTYLSKERIQGNFINNEDLSRYYDNADIVLNDHWADMKKNGFISNRVFDVTACNSFLISDYNSEIKRIYGDAIPMYKNIDDFEKLVRYYLENPQERKDKAKQAHKITLKHFTADKIAEEFIKLIKRQGDSS